MRVPADTGAATRSHQQRANNIVVPSRLLHGKRGTEVHLNSGVLCQSDFILCAFSFGLRFLPFVSRRRFHALRVAVVLARCAPRACRSTPVLVLRAPRSRLKVLCVRGVLRLVA